MTAFAGLLLALCALQDPETRHDLSLERHPAEGEQVELDHSREQSMKLVVKMGEQVLQEQTQSESSAVQGRAKVLKVAEGKVVEVVLDVARAARTRNGQESVLGVSGKTVQAKRAIGGAWEFTVDGQALSPEETAVLREAMPGGRADDTPSGKAVFAPKMPVKAGESWPVDLEKLARSFGEGKLTFDLEKSKGTMTLKSVEKREGALFGLIDGEITLLVKSMGPLPLETPLPLKLAPSIDACIDGRTPDAAMSMKGTMKGTTEAKPPGAEEALTLDLDMTVGVRLRMKRLP